MSKSGGLFFHLKKTLKIQVEFYGANISNPKQYAIIELAPLPLCKKPAVTIPNMSQVIKSNR
jgi:hypothetical protein